MLSDTPLTPRQIFRLYDRGQLTREQFREALSVHAIELIGEMEDVHQNPHASWVEALIAKVHASRLARAHGEALVRSVLVALSEVTHFAPARFLWDADRVSVPLYCFFRARREPLFRLLRLVSAPFLLEAIVEHGTKGNLIKERFILDRDRHGELIVKDRKRA